MQANVHSLTIDGELDGIAKSSEWAAEMASTLDLPPTVAFAMDVCFEEALANIIVHGLKDAPSVAKQVRLSLMYEAGVLRVVIEDRGVPFDPLTAQEPQAPADLAEAKIGGLGVSLMRKLTQGMTYERAGDMNRLTLDFAAS